jgi:AcrR family transcriptional regulator
VPRTPIQLQQIRDERQAALLEAARRVFVRRGYGGARMADIAAEAQASYGLLYHYFPTKEAIYLALVRTAVEGSVSVTAAARDRPGDPLERLRWLTDEILHGMRDQPELPLLMAQAAAGEEIPAAARAEAARAARQTMVNVTAIVAAGQATGQLAAGDPDELAWTYLALVLGLGISALVWGELPRPSASTATVLRLLRP